MKKLLEELFKSFLILFILFSATYLYYIYIPPSAKNLSRQIDSSDPDILNEDRLNLSSQLAKYLSKGLPKDENKTPTLLHLFLANQRKLLDLRIKHAISYLKKTPVENNKIQIISLLNMGAIIKTPNHIIAFDVADMPLSTSQKHLATLADIFLVTHADSDHYDPALLKQALEQGKTVIFPHDFFFMYDNLNFNNVYKLKNGQSITTNGVQITAYQTDHRLDKDFDESNAWYLVDVDTYKILHTGDGVEFKDKNLKQQLNQTNDVDIFLVNAKIHPYDIRDIHPKLAIPLHLFKFMHNRQELDQSTFNAVLNTYHQYDKDLKDINIKFLFPGESIFYQTDILN